jgi:hypothetical protein
MRMLDGVNEGWIEFESDETDSWKGDTSLMTVLQLSRTKGSKHLSTKAQTAAAARGRSSFLK